MEYGVVMYIISGRGMKTGSARALVCTLVNGTSENKHFNFNQAILLGSFFLNQLSLKITVIYTCMHKKGRFQQEKKIYRTQRRQMCACLLRHPKKSNVFRKIRVTPLRYVFTANDNHSKKRFFFGVAKSSPTSVLQLRFFFVLQSSLKSDFIWSLLLVCRVGKKCFTKMKTKLCTYSK